MDLIKNEFFEKLKLIIDNNEKFNEIKILLNDFLVKCAKAFELREGVILLDENLNIIESDDVFNNFFNINKKDLIDRNIQGIFPDEFKDVIEKFFIKVNEKKYYEQKNLIIRLNNKSRHFDIKGEILELKNKKIFLLLFRNKDINSTFYLLENLEEEVSNLVLRIRDFESLMKEILRVFINSELFDYGWVAKIDKELKQVIPVVTLNEEKEDIEFKSKIFDFNYFKGILDMLISHEEFIVDEVKFRDTLYRKSIIFPIFKKWEYGKEEDIEYAVLIYSEKNIEFSDDEFVLLKEIIYKINIAIADIFVKEKANILISTDVLTNLPKREIFINEIKKHIKENIPFAVVLIDIDKLKKVNSVLGFWAGDKAIKNLSSFLKRNFEKSCIARVGSDEFGIILKGEKLKIFEKLNKILEYNEKIVKINGSSVYLPISLGVSFYPDDGVKEEDLILKAEKALEETKKRGGKGISYANENLTLLPKDYLELEKELKEAIKNNEYVMYYQPIIDIKENKVWGVEALLRWNSKKRGLVSPAKFIPILEESGLIREVGDVIMDNVLKDAKEFEDENIYFTFSINVSVIQLLSENLALKLINKIKDIGVNKEKIIVEITESVLMENIDSIMPQIEILKNEGINIEIDDFGTGYSSLSYLKKLPVSALKIDQSFVKDILDDYEDEQIVKAIISMAKALNKKTIAEGAESKEIVDELKSLGVDYIQGYYFAKPMPKEELREFLASF